MSKCPGNPICAKCGSAEENHDFDECKSPLKCNNCKGDHAAFSRDCPIWKEEKEILNVKYTKNLSFPEARQFVKQRRADQAKFSFSASYAGVATPAKEECHTCVILAKLILNKFPEMVNDLKDILPKSTLIALTPKKPSAPLENPPPLLNHLHLPHCRHQNLSLLKLIPQNLVCQGPGLVSLIRMLLRLRLNQRDKCN